MRSFFNVVLVILVILALAVVGMRVSGYMPFTVSTESMTPSISPGDIVVVKKCDFDLLQTGDVITFVKNEQGEIASHRIVSIDTEENLVRTKGDANKYEDINPVYAENIIGKVSFKIPFIGKIYLKFKG